MSNVKMNKIFKTILKLPKCGKRQGEGGLRTRGYFKKDLPKKPLITVITVVFNGENVLEETILSVINQNYENIEYIIIDGYSKDNTLGIIRKYNDVLDYWISEEDKGIYDAMNKGIVTASGEFISFLNSGDCYFDNNVISSLPLNSSNKIIYGNVKYKSGKVFESTFDNRMYLKNTLHHQATFYSIDLYEILGLFDINFRILADYDFNLKVLNLNVKSEKVPFYIAECLDYGVSDIPKLINYNEEIKIRFNNNHYIGLLLGSYSYLRYIGKKILRIFCSIKNTKFLLSNK